MRPGVRGLVVLVWIGLLGPFEAADDADTAVRLPARLRVLLAVLVLSAGKPVAGDALAEFVWDAAPPSGYATTLRSHVVRLRRALPKARIEAGGAGYTLTAPGLSLDVVEFEALCAQANAAGRAGEWHKALDAVAAALGLWRGAPLVDVPSQVLRDRVVPRLEQVRERALEQRAEAGLHLGRYAQVAADLQEAVTQHPLRERLRAQLMLALSRDGRQAEALAAYQDARRVLVEQLGIEPGAQLRRLHERILAGDESDLPTPVQAEHLAPSAGPGAPTPRQLPAAAGHFTGRFGELEWLTGLPGLPDPAGAGGTVVISAIDGMAGIGKTALAVHAAHRVADLFEGGQLFVDLHGYTMGHPPREPGQALQALLRALGVPPNQIPEDTEECSALYRQRLTGTGTLIVLDNALNEAQVRPLLPSDPGCLVLITSRRRLKGLDDARSLSLDLLPPADAAALLRAVAGAGRIAADDPLLGEVAALCGHLPLALRIAGALLRHRPAWSLGHLAALLRDRRDRVSVLSDGDRDLATVFDLSHRLLDPQHRLLLCRLALAPGPDTDPYAAAALSDTDPAAAIRQLEGLVDHNLLIAHAPGRYRLHDLIRAHTATLAVSLEGASERDAALGRLLHYYAHTAQTASLLIARTPRPAPGSPAPVYAPEHHTPEAARAWLRDEHHNLDAAFTHAHTRTLDEHTTALAAGLAEILRIDGPWARALKIHQTAADTARRRDRPAACAKALTNLGIVRRLSGDLPGAGDVLARALEIFREIGHRQGEAGALTELGVVKRLLGDVSGAGDVYTQALAIFREIGHRHGEAATLAELGIIRRLNGDLSGADSMLVHALEICRRIGHRSGEAYSLTELGHVRHLAGDSTAAAEALRQALDIFRETSNRNDEAWALNYYAAVIVTIGDLPRAIEVYEEALAMNRELDKPDDEAISLEGIGECHLAEDDLTRGTDHLRQALEIFQRLGMAPDVERVHARLAGLAAV